MFWWGAWPIQEGAEQDIEESEGTGVVHSLVGVSAVVIAVQFWSYEQIVQHTDPDIHVEMADGPVQADNRHEDKNRDRVVAEQCHRDDGHGDACGNDIEGVLNDVHHKVELLR